MTKKISTLVLVGALAATSAQASNARQQVLGTQDPFNVLSSGDHGSFLYEDRGNSFYNPAYVNDFKNWASIEKTNSLTSSPTNNAGAEGGFVSGFGPVTAGVYFNRADINTNIDSIGAHSRSSVNSFRPFDFMIGGDMGIKWGLGAEFLMYKGRTGTDSINGQTNSFTDITLKAGVSIQDFEPYVRYKIAGKDQQYGTIVGFAPTSYGSTTSVVGQGSATFNSWGAGLRYHWGEWTPFAAYRSDWINITAPANMPTLQSRAWGFGFARNMKVAEGANLFYGTSFWRMTDRSSNLTATNASNSTQSGIAQGGINHTRIPVSVSVEAEATNWLVLRAGLTHSLIAVSNNGSEDIPTTGRLGAGLKLGKAALDWAIGGSTGTTTTNNVTAPTANTNNTAVDSQSFDFANGMFTTASLSYNW